MDWHVALDYGFRKCQVCLDQKTTCANKDVLWQIFVFIRHVGKMDGHVALDLLTMSFGNVMFAWIEKPHVPIRMYSGRSLFLSGMFH